MDFLSVALVPSLDRWLLSFSFVRVMRRIKGSLISYLEMYRFCKWPVPAGKG